MQHSDALLRLLREFFNLPPDVQPQEITQNAVAAWDSLAMVQLIADLQGTFRIDFDVDEIGRLRSYEEIRATLLKKGVSLVRQQAAACGPEGIQQQNSRDPDHPRGSQTVSSH